MIPSRIFSRTKTVIVAAVLGGIVVAVPIWRRSQAAEVRLTVPTTALMSVDKAQRLVSFPIVLPLKENGISEVLGIRVTHIVDNTNYQQLSQEAIQNTTTIFGFGIAIAPIGSQMTVRSLHGSPAERAGIPDHPVEILAYDGYSFPNVETVKKLVSHEPLIISFRGSDGKIRQVKILHREKFIFHPDPPIKIPQDNYIIMECRAHGRNYELSEAPQSLNNYFKLKAADVKELTVSGKQVSFIGEEEYPTVGWTDASRCYFLVNHRALNQQEVEEIISLISESEGDKLGGKKN